MEKYKYMKLKVQDSDQIDQFIQEIVDEYEDGIYFDEFMKLSYDVTGDLFYSVYHCFYKYIPCVQNFLIMRQNFKKFLTEQLDVQPNFTYTEFQKPLIFKLVDRIVIHDKPGKSVKKVQYVNGKRVSLS